MIKKFIGWYFSPTEKLIVEEHDVYSKIVELEERIAKLEEENIETSNTLYEIMNSIDAVDVRIDILTVEKWINKDV
jgi:septal ring factor EnvC (AmiA/AmiB activator)